MAQSGWKQLLAGWPWFQGPDNYPIAAYSEYIPPPRLGRKPYGNKEPSLFAADDPWGWHVNEYEEILELRPGMRYLASHLLEALTDLARGQGVHGLAKKKLAGNPCWPAELSTRASACEHERYVVLLPLALSRTLDDKGRVRWTLFGASEQGPARAFWKSFFTAPGRELPREQGVHFIRNLLHAVYGEPEKHLQDLKGAGFRILAQDHDPLDPLWRDEDLPGWTKPFLWKKDQPVRGLKYLLTFQPFEHLPASVKRAYLGGKLHLLPCPASLLFWGARPYGQLRQELPLAMQIPLLHVLPRHEKPYSIRVPQSGYLHEARSGQQSPGEQHGPVRNTYKRTNRWDRVHRFEDELAVLSHEDHLAKVLFSIDPDFMGLYGKPMAKNVQIWSRDFHLLLDGPRASAEEIDDVIDLVGQGGLFGYRFLFPAMRVGLHELYWHRPLVAYRSAETGQPTVLEGGPLGYLTAYREDRPRLERPVELWPRLSRRELHLEAVELFRDLHEDRPHKTTLNVRKLLDTWEIFGEQPLPRSFARQVLSLPNKGKLEDWLDSLPARASDADRGRQLVSKLTDLLEPETTAEPLPNKSKLPETLTFQRTSRRSFEVAYWKTIANLSTGKFINKDNADCPHDRWSKEWYEKHHRHHHRDLDELGDFLISYYQRRIAAAGMKGKALAGDLPFRWRTDFNFSWSGGWSRNQDNQAEERNIIAIIPGRDRSRAVIMADHYDTAYMYDHYEQKDGLGPRLAAAGADDNHSATAALMLGAPIFLELSKAGRLECDIWLIHLTGEEFPSDCLGARHLCEKLVEGTLQARLPQGRLHDLSQVRVQGVYVLDMVAHNNDRDRDEFQISPGTGATSMWLAYQAHLANEAWNACATSWNRRSSRKGCHRGRRSSDPARVPALALHPHLSGTVRLPYDPRSTLYNTDGQIFSDTGVPVVLFMENYDINRAGYHDSQDTMDNIDLDYGSAVAAIAIESVARAATEPPPASLKDLLPA